MKNKNNGSLNLNKEIEWYDKNSFQKSHILNSKIFFSKKRNNYAYIFPKERLFHFIKKRVDAPFPKVLIAPFGTGSDVKYVESVSNDITGIDISETAVSSYKELSMVKKYVGDMSNMNQFHDNTFDIVYVSLFFHHFIGKFDVFLNEIYRVLKPGGYIFILEPSILYPFSWITRSVKVIAGNITGQVEDEAPFLPLRMTSALKRCKYKYISHQGASFSHNRFPILLQNFINKTTKFMLYMPIINNFCWMCIFSAKK